MKKSWSFLRLKWSKCIGLSNLMTFTLLFWSLSLFSMDVTNQTNTIGGDGYQGVRSDRLITQNNAVIENAQQPVKTVTGKVVNTKGEPIPGASIVIKGTLQGTISDMDGNFTLNDVPEDAVLSVAFLGMSTQEISVTGQS
jgi:hypothetical protein